MGNLLIVGCGGFLGAVTRYGLSGLVHRYYGGGFPLGTLAVNVLGCLLLGAIMALVQDRQLFAPNMRIFVTIGILGAFTTFSTFGYESSALLHDQEFRLASLNVVANVVLGLAAVELARSAVRFLGA